MSDFLRQMFRETPVLPVVVLEDAADALPLAEALAAGGIKNIEITLRTDSALSAIEAITKARPDIIVGAGTVFTPEQARAASAAGARYIVSPGYSAKVHAECIEEKVDYLPGAVTAHEIQAAQENGLSVLKFFPAEVSGGVAMLKALAPVFPEIGFCATGGVTLQNAPSYLVLPNIVGVGMSSLTPSDALKEKDLGKITKLAFEARRLA